VNRAAAGAMSVALIAATLSPVLRDPDDDGFPLSTYPMFAAPRPRAYVASYALGVTAGGERRYLPPALVGSPEVLQADAIVARAVEEGGAALDELCRAIAARVARDPAYGDVAAIRIVIGTHDALDFLIGDRIGRELERARCVVGR